MVSASAGYSEIVTFILEGQDRRLGSGLLISSIESFLCAELSGNPES